jgi:hypothetical protein
MRVSGTLKPLTLSKASRYTDFASPACCDFQGGQMKKFTSLWLGILFASLFTLTFVTAQSTIAQDHVVAPSAIQRDVAASSSARQKNQAQLQDFVSSPQAQEALKTAHLDSNQVKNAVPNLNNEEMAELSARSEKAQADFVAGKLSDRDLIIILLAIVALILIIVAVR